MQIGNQIMDLKHHTFVMGILNVTPDSFSDGGSYTSVDQALYHAQEMIEQGAAIIDVGGESTRPGYQMVSDQEEIQRTAPVIHAIKSRFDIPVSLDTYKSAVAMEGIKAGADIINDIWGLQYDARLGNIIADTGVTYILMHNRQEPSQQLSMKEFLQQAHQDVERALSYGIKPQQLIYDPGIGFAKSQEDNLLILGNLQKLQTLSCPLLLGTSRKSVIHYVLDTPIDQRLEGTLATTAMAVNAHVGIVRVHDVLENVRFIKMMEEMRDRYDGTDIY